MSAKTTATANKVLDKFFGQTNFTPPVAWFIGFLDADENELSGNGYARVEVENSTINFPNAASGSKTCQLAIETPEATADWSTAVFIAFYDASALGNKWFQKAITPFTVLAGQTYQIPIGNLVLTES